MFLPLILLRTIADMIWLVYQILLKYSYLFCVNLCHMGTKTCFKNMLFMQERVKTRLITIGSGKMHTV